MPLEVSFDHVAHPKCMESVGELDAHGVDALPRHVALEVSVVVQDVEGFIFVVAGEHFPRVHDAPSSPIRTHKVANLKGRERRKHRGRRCVRERDGRQERSRQHAVLGALPRHLEGRRPGIRAQAEEALRRGSASRLLGGWARGGLRDALGNIPKAPARDGAAEKAVLHAARPLVRILGHTVALTTLGVHAVDRLQGGPRYQVGGA